MFSEGKTLHISPHNFNRKTRRGQVDEELFISTWSEVRIPHLRVTLVADGNLLSPGSLLSTLQEKGGCPMFSTDLTDFRQSA